MSRNRRLLVAALTVIALFSAIVLTAGLSSLPGDEQRPSSLSPRVTPIETPEASVTESAVEAHAETLSERTLLPMVIIAISLLVLIIFMIVTAEGRKMLIYALLMLLVIVFVVLLREPPPAGLPEPDETPAQASEETSSAPATTFAFEPPPWLILGASLGLALLLIGGIALAGVRLSRRQRPTFTPSPLPELAEEARRALFDLRAGLDLQNTIIRCYQEMSETLQEYRGLRRNTAMTPQEFARALAPTNLPQADIWRITNLFERVRYGQHKLAPEEEKEAIACLTAIVQACEEPI